MTANFRSMELEHPPLASRTAASPARLTPAVLADISDRVAFPATILILLFIYGLLQNPYWVPAGDSELYTAAARNIAIGQGYTFNGQSVAIIPPGWSWMMAAVMKVTPYVLPLKLLVMLCMIGSLAIDYWIVRRFVSPAKAVGIILLTAIISHVYQATYWLISESAFCLATSATILLALQIAEGREGRRGGKQFWRIALLLLCCAAAITIRWAGVLGAFLLIAILLKGELKPKLTTQWVTALLVVLITGATFVTIRIALRGTAEQTAAASDMVTGTGEDTGTLPAPDTGPPITGSANQSAKAYHLFPTGSYADRFLNFGRWFSYLYWQPFRAAGASAYILAAATLTGWVVIVVLSVLVIETVRRKQWLWLALGVYAGALALGWTNVNARYYVPVTFLITLGMFLATDELIALAANRRAWRIVTLCGFVAFVAGVALCNGSLYAVEVSIARSERFYTRYEDGLNMSLITACQYLNSLADPPKDGQVAVSQRYTNLNKAKASPFGLRASALLLNKVIVTPRFKDTTSPPNKSDVRAGRDIRRWLNSKGVKYYLYQPEISPWRVWHFRLGWYEKMQTGHTAEKDTAGWQLYVFTPGAEDDWAAIRVPNKFQPVTRVPGL